ncbi:histidine phosphatase family protein [Chthonobacter rhizosphaerae]|uniref:histidine phosphatase family protein n=1 Tax=Chthonobacter rhizosphaerae TaxID=2735553 RepID=UPI0015EF5F15
MVHLVRHAAHAHVGRILTGRAPGAHLAETGRAQAAALARRFAGARLAAIHASPRERARETAEAIAAPHGIAVTVAEDLDEIDFGRWTGMSFDALEADPDWRRWNAARSLARAPDGETMAAAQGRMVRHLHRMTADGPEGAVVLVGHADPIKAVVAAVLGLGLDALHRFDVDPASVTTIDVEPHGARLVRLNDRGPDSDGETGR